MLNKLNIKEVVEGLKTKKFSSSEVTKDCLRRIYDVEERVKAYVSINEEDALKEAKEKDEIITEDAFNDRPLLGVPIAIKDNFCTKNIRTTASSNVLKNYIPPYDATVVKRLKDAGAVILGKTNMDAWAHGTSTETSDFFTTKNPWDLDKLPGGSSGGSAAAVAADEAIAAIGSETAGSIRIPASWCGITGFKPTYGRVSRYGVIAMGSSLDSPGPMTKTAWDAAYIMSVISGKDGFDATAEVETNGDYLSLNKDIKGLKIGIPTEYLDGVDKEILEKIEVAKKEFEKLGVTFKEISLFDPEFAIAVYTIIQRSEVSSNLGRYDGVRYGEARDKFGDEAKRRIMLGTYCLSSGYYDEYYKKAQKVRTIIIKDFEKAFEEVDFIMGPVAPTTALPVGSSKTSPMFGELMDKLVEPSSIAGITGISIPVGMSKDNLPIGLQIIGPKFSESEVLNLAHKFQLETEFHTKKPELE